MVGIIIIALYLVDLLIAGDDDSRITWIKNNLNERFKMKDLGEATLILCLEATRNRSGKTLQLSQSTYTDAVLQRFWMENYKPLPTPMKVTSEMEMEMDEVTNVLLALIMIRF